MHIKQKFTLFERSFFLDQGFDHTLVPADFDVTWTILVVPWHWFVILATPRQIEKSNPNKIVMRNHFSVFLLLTTMVQWHPQSEKVELFQFEKGSATSLNILNCAVVKWVWVNTYRYIFSGLFTSINPSYDLGFTRGTRFWPIPKSSHMIFPRCFRRFFFGGQGPPVGVHHHGWWRKLLKAGPIGRSKKKICI